MNQRTSLRRRLLHQFTTLALLPILAVTAVGAAVLLPGLLSIGDQRNFELATAVRDLVEQQLTTRERLALRRAAEIAAGPLVGSDITASLHAFIDGDPLLLAAYVTDRDGIVEQVALQPGSAMRAADLVGLDQSMQPHFRAASQAQKPIWSLTHLSLLTGRISAVLVVPFGKGALFTELALNGLSQSLAEIGAASQTRAIIIDRLGRVIGHPDARRASQQESLADIALVRKAIKGQPGTDRLVSDGVQYLAHALPVAPIGWTVLVMQPTHVVLGPLFTLGKLLAGSVVIAIVLTLVMVRRLANSTGGEVERLAQAARVAAHVEPMSGPDMHFHITEFQALWDRLRSLFAELHERDRQTDTARRELQGVLDAATEVAIVATDTQGTITMFSRGAQKMLGYAPADVVGRRTPATWHDTRELAQQSDVLSRQIGRRVEGFDLLACHARDAGFEVRDWMLVRADGRRLDASLAVTAMHTAEGMLSGFLVVAIDVSQRRRAAELEVAQRTANEANLAKTEFLSRMSHELRTPLNAVLGYAQMMELSESEPPTDQQRQHLQQIQTSGWHLVRLIDDVLDLTRIESGSARLVLEATDLMQAAQRAHDIVSTLLRTHGAQLTIALGSGAEGRPLPSVRADKTRLVQILTNLLSNAIKYGRPGGRVLLECAPRADRRLAITVADDGIGMDEQQLAQLFQPFNRLGRERSAVHGTGIGLVITKRYVELMGGSIQVDSQVDVGTRVTFTLPLAAHANEAWPPAPDPAPASRGGLAHGVVLYIEDDPVNAMLMREVLRQRPAVQLLEADSLKQGVELARHNRLDLILLDMHLPDGSGGEALDQLRSCDANGRTAVVVVSADATRAQIDQMLERGVQAYLTKPIDVAQTLATIDQVLGAPLAAPAPRDAVRPESEACGAG